ncbi:unnamed protein product [Mytilus edulis]|uniref:DZIP3-like HEPN domain-containing protein n=1 Tax=Mytilus edulis TaxID=6550 RepID=A0A8S3VL74_MYTED|nr:unnamed protein product [Mytilus edulis]
MVTKTREAQELLRLFKCVVDTGTDVLTAFAKDKLLTAYNGNFKHFLDDKKHELFHLWKSRKLLCCECPPAGCNLTQTVHMPNWIFKRIYDETGPVERRHIVRHGSNIVQVCLHKYVTRNIAIHELDFSTILFLLQNLAKLSQTETTSLDVITTTRSKICHACSTNCYPMTLLNTTWTKLENALVDLVDPCFKQIIRRDIKQFRKADLEKEEITELMQNVEEVKIVLEELKSSCNNNIHQFKGMESRLENMSINNTEDIKHHTTEQMSFFTTQAQHAISNKIQHTEEKIETKLHETTSDIKKVKENQEKFMGKNYDYDLDAMECPVLWQIATPKDWNLEAVEATLRNPSNKDDQFKKKFVRKGSLIMLTTILASILSDSEAFESAIMSFLTKMIEDCDIKTETPGRLEVRLHLLDANEGL